MTTSAKRETPINLRALPAQRDLIDRARQLTDKSRTEFVLQAACREAESTLLDQRLFVLDEQRFAAFEDALDAPVKDNPALRRLMNTPAPWD